MAQNNCTWIKFDFSFTFLLYGTQNQERKRNGLFKISFIPNEFAIAKKIE